MSRRRRAVLAVVLLAAGALLIWIGTRPTSPEAREATADALVGEIAAGVTIDASSLLATRAIADFGVGQDVGLVLVRIVDALTVEVRLESPTDVSFARPVLACLVGPDAAPDDAGLESRCWAAAELGPLLEAQLARDGQGRFQLTANDPVTVRTTVQRGGAGCDYPPGAWHLELLVDPIVAGEPAGPRYLPDATFEIGYDPGETLQFVAERRYCGLANRVYREQGEPAITSN